ncbi:metalloregulator ArsR/SmtB family transcription factor [Micromonospora sp. 15K316]|uniref:helix-turn-helix transcriptional regulator n=1 Tax=Micromonospora sp. 15K316 TaxID=2530376 RepID=UPI00140430D9|nr:helix-turn-helix domain-containing protein [Micromonospora sp. 15K316]
MSSHVSYGALAVPTRRHLLDTLRAQRRPMDLRELAAITGLHANTVRFHLEVLTRAGFVAREQASRTGPGRPAALYRNTSPGTSGGGYQLLVEILAERLTEADAEGLAEQAGQKWLDTSAPSTPPADADPLGTATTRSVALFTELGFAPTPETATSGTRIELHACPFIDEARRHPDVVCGVHRGLLRGVAEAVAPGGLTTSLTPFARPGVCLAEISR